MRGNRRQMVGAAMAAALVLGLIEGLPSARREDAQAATRYKTRTTRLARGLEFVRMLDRRGPNRIKILKLDPATQHTLDVELATEEIPGHETTSSMARRRRAVAAINGDYTLLPSDSGAGRPVDLFAEDGELVASPLIYGRNFALTQDEEHSYVGHPRFSVTLAQSDTTKLWKVPAWNADLEEGKLAAYTTAGGWAYRPPARGCSVRLLPAGDARLWAEAGTRVRESYLVDAARCTNGTRMKRKGGVVLSAVTGSSDATKLMEQLTVGEPVALGWTAGWPGVLDTIGGNPSLLENGEFTVGPCEASYFCDRNPRTGIGVKANGKILLVTVDGRRKGSIGMTPMQFARLFKRLGAVSALNLDGGGSTTMWIKGKGLVNVPSEGPERPVGSSILILRGADPDEVSPMPEPEPTPTPSPTPSGSPSVLPSPTPIIIDPWPPLDTTFPKTSFARPAPPQIPCFGLHDPASTGGLLDALALGDFGPTPRLPASLRSALRVYRGQAGCRSFSR